MSFSLVVPLDVRGSFRVLLQSTTSTTSPCLLMVTAPALKPILTPTFAVRNPHATRRILPIVKSATFPASMAISPAVPSKPRKFCSFCHLLFPGSNPFSARTNSRGSRILISQFPVISTSTSPLSRALPHSSAIALLWSTAITPPALLAPTSLSSQETAPLQAVPLLLPHQLSLHTQEAQLLDSSAPEPFLPDLLRVCCRDRTDLNRVETYCIKICGLVLYVVVGGARICE